MTVRGESNKWAAWCDAGGMLGPIPPPSEQSQISLLVIMWCFNCSMLREAISHFSRQILGLEDIAEFQRANAFDLEMSQPRASVPILFILQDRSEELRLRELADRHHSVCQVGRPITLSSRTLAHHVECSVIFVKWGVRLHFLHARSHTICDIIRAYFSKHSCSAPLFAPILHNHQSLCDMRHLGMCLYMSQLRRCISH